MLFWLTLIQSLPTPSTDPIEASTYDPNDVPRDTILANNPATHSSNFATDSVQQTQQIEESAVMAVALEDAIASPPTPYIAQLGGLLIFPGIIAGIVVLLLLSVWAYTRVYVITPTNEAFVRTGGVFIKKKSVILNGGCVVLPGFHELTRVPLREISIDVERTGKLAVRTQDYLRADMRVTFYVCISASDEDVLIAAARLSQNGKITPEDIKNALEKRADDAIRAAAKRKSLAEIDSDKLGFAQEVLNLVQQDLGKVGLTLNNIAISEVHESDTYDENNFFDAQGVRLRTETIQRSIQQKREVELETHVEIEQKELEAEKRSLQINQEKEEARLQQQLEVEALKAQREREIQEARDRQAASTQRTKILQEKSVEEEEIRRNLAIEQAQIDVKIELEERNKTFKVAQTQQRQEAEIAEIDRKKTVDSQTLEARVQVAESDRLAKMAQEDVVIALARKRQESFLAEAEKAQAEASVQTATEVAVAERQKRLTIFAAEEEAEKQRIADQNVVEIDVFRRRRQAEVAKQAAELEAEAIRILAEAERDKAEAEGDGIHARISARNAISNATLLSETLVTLWPELSANLPQLLRSLTPQPGVLGDTRIYSFPGGSNGEGSAQDINKLLLSTSGLSLVNTLLEEGKLGNLIGQVRQLIQNDEATPNDISPEPNSPMEDEDENRASS